MAVAANTPAELCAAVRAPKSAPTLALAPLSNPPPWDEDTLICKPVSGVAKLWMCDSEYADEAWAARDCNALAEAALSIGIVLPLFVAEAANRGWPPIAGGSGAGNTSRVEDRPPLAAVALAAD